MLSTMSFIIVFLVGFFVTVIPMAIVSIKTKGEKEKFDRLVPIEKRDKMNTALKEFHIKYDKELKRLKAETKKLKKKV
jgi:hypothetical protein